MNHCIDCGQQVKRGCTKAPNKDAVTCLVCQVARVMRDWRYTRKKER